MRSRIAITFVLLAAFGINASAQELSMQLRQQRPVGIDQFERQIRTELWIPTETAIIVCDVWDKHHCLNAVRRMEEFLPRMNDLLKKSREAGVIIIHSPSDCMPAYEHHPARQRAIESPATQTPPKDVEYWCSKIPAEVLAVYPIDQSDGGEDDDPAEHARWAAELKALGRNPGLPWKTQSPMIEIDEATDFISDRGDEVWNVLESRGIKNVILVGVHTNMCVLGRPFGLRQMARNGKNVVLMRDLTDCMYNPKRWPFVDHFTGNDLIVSHIERYVCPTVTSDQILGGEPFRSKYDTRKVRDLMELPPSHSAQKKQDSPGRGHWTTIDWQGNDTFDDSSVLWLRCSVRTPADWLKSKGLTLQRFPDQNVKAWLNGQPFMPGDEGSLNIGYDVITPDDINLLVLRIDRKAGPLADPSTLSLQSATGSMSLSGRWQYRFDDEAAHSNIPLPAKFGIGSDVLFEPHR